MISKRLFPYKLHTSLVLFCYLLPELGMFLCIKPSARLISLFLGLLYAIVFTGICLSLPKTLGMIVFAISSFPLTAWAMAQIIYYDLFKRLMWTNDVAFASDGVIFLDDVLSFYAPPLWWILVVVFLSCYFWLLFTWSQKKALPPSSIRKFWLRTAAGLLLLCFVERLPFLNENNLTQGTIPVYRSSGFYHLLKEDIRTCWLEPHLPGYQETQNEYRSRIDLYFAQRPQYQENSMTGTQEGKNVIVFLMESLDDWMISPDQMPTVSAIMEESIVFTDFYTPFYGTTRSINTEVCLGTGVYFPTNGNYFYDFLDNSFSQSLPNILRQSGYTSQIFHHNFPDYYRRTELIPAIGYDCYHSYIVDAGQDEVLDDSYPFDSSTLRQQFFRDELTFNLLITQAAHLPYGYDDPMSILALEKHPEYLGAYETEEEDCIRAKARLIDDTFARLLKELEKEELLDNTVIVALSDHYPYGYSDTEQLLEYAGGFSELLCLDNTPCFIWSADIDPMTINKTLNTSDLFPTLLNLLGIRSEYNYLGRDAFDPNYEGYAFFPDGSWVSDGVMYKKTINGNQTELTLIDNKYGKAISNEWMDAMTEAASEFTEISNLILVSDYYKER